MNKIPLFPLILAIILLAPTNPAGAQNKTPPMGAETVTLTVATPNSARGVTLYTGKIIAYERKSVELLTQNNSQVSLPPGRIVRMEFTREADLQQAEKSFAQKNFAEALAFFQDALRREARPLVRALITEKIIRCLRELGKNTEAVTEFIKLAEANPEMPDEMFSCIPLAWQPDIADTLTPQRVAKLYNERKTPVTQLLYGSYHLSSGQRAQAVAALNTVAKNKDIRLSTLAEMQLWRISEPKDLTEDALARRESLLERIPPDFRAGPCFLMGQAYTLTKNDDLAALAFLKAATVYHQSAPLSASAMLEAAKACARDNHPEEAEILYHDLIAKFPDTPAAAQAKRLLSQEP